MNKEQKRLKQILLMPIVESNINGFYIKDDKIFSGFSYGNKFDPDMSNVAVEFYSKLYDFDEETILSKSHRNIKGDTINSSSPYYKPSCDTTIEWDEKNIVWQIFGYYQWI